MRTPSNRRRVALIAAVLAALLTACGSTPPPPAPDLVIGADAADPDSLLLAHVYAAALRYYGTPVRVQTIADPLAELDSGAATIVAGRTGAVLTRLAPGVAGRGDAQVYKAMIGVLPEGVTAGDYTTAAEDKPALAVTKATAKTNGKELAGLAKRCATARPGKVRGTVVPTALGGCKLPASAEFADVPALFDALRAGSVNAAWTTTADPTTPGDVVLLTDGKPALIRAENGVALYRRNELAPQQVVALNEVAGVLDTAALTKMRGALATGADPQALAQDWLAENPIGAQGH